MLINDVFCKNTPSSFPQKLYVDGRVYTSNEVIADVLNPSFVTSSQAIFTPICPSKATDANTIKCLLIRQVNYIFLSPTIPEEIHLLTD